VALEVAKGKIREFHDLGLTPDRGSVADTVAGTYESWDPKVSGVCVLDDEIRKSLALAIAGIAIHLFEASIATGTEA